MPAALAHPVVDLDGKPRPAVGRDDAGLVHHLQLDGDHARRLEDADAVVVVEREHRGRHAAGDAAVPAVEIGDPVEGLPGAVARAHERAQALAFRRLVRQPAVGRIDEQGGPPVRRAGLDPVAHAELAVLLLGGEAGGRGRELLHPRGVFLIGQEHAVALLGRALQGREVEVVDRPGSAQVRLTPRGLLRLIVLRHRRNDRQVLVLGGRDRRRAERGGRDQDRGRHGSAQSARGRRHAHECL